MKRTNIHLTEPQLELLDQLSKLTGLSVAELVRRAVDDYFKSLVAKAGKVAK